MASDRSLFAIAGGIVATVLAVVAVVLLLGDRLTASFPPDTPEATVQAYLSAWEDEDFDAAYGYFSSAVKSRVSLEAFRQAAGDQGFGFPGGPQHRRVTIDRVEVEEDRAEVYLAIEYSFDGGLPFLGGGAYRDSRTIHLTREAGAWRIDDTLLGLEPGPFPPDGFEP